MNGVDRDNALDAESAPSGWRQRHARFGAARWITRLRWRLNRLRCMTPAEIGHRVFRSARARAERWGRARDGRVPAADLSQLPARWIQVAPQVERSRYVAAADRIASGRLDVFALKNIDLGSPPRWNRDPKTGVEAPLAFGKLLDYRDPNLVGDIKYLWEPNRHRHLVTLAQAYALTGARKYFAVIQSHLESWFAACPCPMGPNWSSALEPAIRLINWAIAWQLLGGARASVFEAAGAAAFRQRWLDSIYQHARFIAGHFSLYSSANNHLIGEAAGLFIAALTWPHWKGSRRWLAAAKAVLEREALLQNAPDGVNREQAVWYQQFVLDLMLLPLLAGRANGVAFSAAYMARIEAMLEHLASIMDAGGHVPMFGDADDGIVAGFAVDEAFCPYRSLLATGAVLFRRADFKTKAGALDDRTRWLLGAAGEAAFAALTGGGLLPVRRTFPEGGYYILGCDFETEDEIRLIADAGPLGYQAIAAHGHADALSFTLSVGGREFLIDPGTYAYHTDAQWRSYFRGTAAHNTLRIDGQDQSQPGGNFLWLKKARAGCSLWRNTPGQDVFEGWHDGYTRLADPVVHRRRIVLDKATRRVVIEDSLRMSRAHDIELFFHCAERCRVEPVPGGYALHQGRKTLLLALPQTPGAAACIRYGSAAPIGGWVSPRFDDKQRSPTIAWSARLAGEVTLRTGIMC